MRANQAVTDPDVAVVGAGIMSATLATMLTELQPTLRIVAFESQGGAALESSNAWSSAGTGHAANCEVSETPALSDGTIDIAKALAINGEFDLSRQFWSYLVRNGAIASARSFIQPVPHMSFVRGADRVAFLEKRYTALVAHHCFEGMEFTQDWRRLREWIPLVMEGRESREPAAATRMIIGADVNYGALTRSLFRYLEGTEKFAIHYGHRVTGIRREPGGRWRIEATDGASGTRRDVSAKFVFLGAGGGALPLLQRSGIPESRGYAGFPVSFLWLRCDDPGLNERHDAKVYGMAAPGSPPLSVPHLDSRIIEGQRSLLFGPYAGFSTKFLKYGSRLDLFRSLRPHSIGPLLAVARHNVGQVLQSSRHRFAALREFFPNANPADWRPEGAGQCVQIIKRDPQQGGILTLGTEVVAASDQSLVALLGAASGASTAVSIMIGVLERCFDGELKSGWATKLKQMIPSYGEALSNDAELLRRVRADTAAVLGLRNISAKRAEPEATVLPRAKTS
jgi:malate dehydrogenase (quinone)